ncbi:MAG: ribosome-binding factor A [Candidatus Moranbacteria bacterium CG_4_10_14_3_um_filter_44_15]|nr:MAG: ribosome-binding factor A [Candidatus Moranbacteria bacterium CG06_land_8_20_14_3_00_43_56]PIV83382.1 MAG: ribosome-binding factor A [Candidatus Moranbacteria bacterium CG17_big_fil_post_rev_8_21_14_2_50_44_12]PIW93007.1 MAG: ribosome-binding factor A [Candidatus Moranbacteria bacterium CG_4_8_14_3_um_filter_43_15]PIX90949.1 MAG: ribosome-binding factor A [Candidatus Moranbacteria bacterium CG_4_10_14_3_um_filter_44_15]PJA86220.1 MAG: ribosome-binding factor A [Candidatus Moranbacteria 
MFSRIDRINELIRETLAEIVARELEMPPGVFVTVVKVDTSRDLRYARVFVSIFPEKKFGRMLELLEKKIYLIQGMLNKKLHMKPLPRIEFAADKTEAEADKIEKLLKEI